MNKKHIIKKYENLLEDVETNSFYTGIDLENRVNVYVCPQGHKTKTIDIDRGVTPFMHTCQYCGAMARSSMYKDTAPEIAPSEEWYRPTLAKVLKMAKYMEWAAIEHILKGGLLSRKIGKGS